MISRYIVWQISRKLKVTLDFIMIASIRVNIVPGQNCVREYCFMQMQTVLISFLIRKRKNTISESTCQVLEDASICSVTDMVGPSWGYYSVDVHQPPVLLQDSRLHAVHRGWWKEDITAIILLPHLFNSSKWYWSLFSLRSDTNFNLLSWMGGRGCC